MFEDILRENLFSSRTAQIYWTTDVTELADALDSKYYF
jgi:hypothetical protein